MNPSTGIQVLVIFVWTLTIVGCSSFHKFQNPSLPGSELTFHTLSSDTSQVVEQLWQVKPQPIQIVGHPSELIETIDSDLTGLGFQVLNAESNLIATPQMGRLLVDVKPTSTSTSDYDLHVRTGHGCSVTRRYRLDEYGSTPIGDFSLDKQSPRFANLSKVPSDHPVIAPDLDGIADSQSERLVNHPFTPVERDMSLLNDATQLSESFESEISLSNPKSLLAPLGIQQMNTACSEFILASGSLKDSVRAFLVECGWLLGRWPRDPNHERVELDWFIQDTESLQVDSMADFLSLLYNDMVWRLS